MNNYIATLSNNRTIRFPAGNKNLARDKAQCYAAKHNLTVKFIK